MYYELSYLKCNKVQKPLRALRHKTHLSREFFLSDMHHT